MKKFRLLSLALSLVIGLSGSTAAKAAVSPSISSDTVKPVSLTQGECYTTGFTVHGTHKNPGITVGNGSVLQTRMVHKFKDTSGNDVYFLKVKAIGKVGEKTSVYTKLPGQSTVKQFTVTVGKPDTDTATPIRAIDETTLIARGGTAAYSFQGKPHTAYTLTVQFGSGNREVAGMGTKTSDSKGIAKWSWKVGASSTCGTHLITVTGGGQTYHTNLLIV